MQCHICAKRRMIGHTISHSNIKTKTQKRPNVRRVRQAGTWMNVCMRCLRSNAHLSQNHA